MSKKNCLLGLLLVLIFNLTAKDPVQKPKSSPQVKATTDTKSSSTANPLLANWTGPYGTYPPFDNVKVSDLKDAMLKAMENNIASMNQIASQKEAPTFKNTIEA